MLVDLTIRGDVVGHRTQRLPMSSIRRVANMLRRVKSSPGRQGTPRRIAVPDVVAYLTIASTGYRRYLCDLPKQPYVEE
jgi:hypothetical protein